MGRMKQLLPLGQNPAILHCLDSVISSGIKDIIVVLGYSGQAIEEVIQDYPVRIVFNSNPESEMAESARSGLKEISNLSTASLVCLADHPLVTPETIKALVNSHRQTPHKIIIPQFKGQRGHPSLFPGPLIDEIFTGVNLRQIIVSNSEKVKTIDVSDEGIVVDMDTPEDYLKICEKLSLYAKNNDEQFCL